MSDINKRIAEGAWKAAMENQAKLRSCDRHHFETPNPVVMGMRCTCTKCGGYMRLSDIATYLKGYQAAGGNPDEVVLGWPGKRDGV